MYYLGIDLGGTNIAAGLVRAGRMTVKGSVPTAMPRPYQEIVGPMAQLVHTLLEQEGLGADALDSIGIGSPGSVDIGQGIVRFAGNLDFHMAPLKQELGRYFSCPAQEKADVDKAEHHPHQPKQ